MVIDKCGESLITSGMPIGIFDSGVGGLTVVRAMEEHLPNENLVYFGDTARYPYGTRSPEIVTEFALQNAGLLTSFGIKLLIVACNTASSVAIPILQKNIDVPLIGVILPGAVDAADSTKNGKIGVIATQGTVKSNAYKTAIHNRNSDVSVFSKACPLFVALATEGFSGDIVQRIAHYYLDELIQEGIDTLVLGCTHYPLLKKDIQEVVGDGVNLIDSADATVKVVKEYLHSNNLINSSCNKLPDKFIVSDSPENFMEIGSNFLKHRINNVNLIRIR